MDDLIMTETYKNIVEASQDMEEEVNEFEDEDQACKDVYDYLDEILSSSENL